MAVSEHDATSKFGHWQWDGGLPVFVETLSPDDEACEWDPVTAPRTNLHWSGFGNRRFQVFADNGGRTAIWDTAHGFRWLTASEPGTGETLVRPRDGGQIEQWGTAIDHWPTPWRAEPPVRTWGPTWFSIEGTHHGIHVRRTLLVPEGETPWLLVRVDLEADHSIDVSVAESWEIVPRGVTVGLDRETSEELAHRYATFEGEEDEHGLTLQERRRAEYLDEDNGGGALPGPPVVLRVCSPHQLSAVAVEDVSDRFGCRVELTRDVRLDPGRRVTEWFMVGLPREGAAPDPAESWAGSHQTLRERLPRGESSSIPALSRELPWHAALLTGGACVDRVIGGHTLDQASAYSFHFGFNGAARDPLQHALPLVYSEPDLALSVLRNTCSWAGPDGCIPWALDGCKEPLLDWYEPSDQALWSFWLAAEYLAATGDVEAFASPVDFHPSSRAVAVPLVEHLISQFRHFVDVVGTGENGHVRILNADWNDSALTLSGIERSVMHERGESVLNSAMATWVLPRFAGVLRRLGGFEAQAREAEQLADSWRSLVAAEWNGRWFRRAHGAGAVVGDDELWLEVQPWAILGGAATPDQASQLLDTIEQTVRRDSPLGARIRGPVPITVPEGRTAGDGTAGGIWFSINMTLAWAAASLRPALAWDELSKMTLHAHTSAYPEIWEGTLAGPDAYNTVESSRPGHTWAWPSSSRGMQSFPVSNLHAHAQVILTYLRLLGVAPNADGTLSVGDTSDTFRSRTFELDGAGGGRLSTKGEVRLRVGERVVEGYGELSW